ncbi:hypothetical protein CC2G_003563 [Coprinopsis cinerea AmutBmut pab1-1]|nr:hypothetical protein CC2G_003563 [Coprinopsis cinerea AmutBmut pab1-1]
MQLTKAFAVTASALVATAGVITAQRLNARTVQTGLLIRDLMDELIEAREYIDELLEARSIEDRFEDITTRAHDAQCQSVAPAGTTCNTGMCDRMGFSCGYNAGTGTCSPTYTPSGCGDCTCAVRAGQGGARRSPSPGKAAAKRK